MSKEEKLEAAEMYADAVRYGITVEGQKPPTIEETFIAGLEYMRKFYNMSAAERKRELRKDPAYREAENARIRERRHTEEYRAKRRAAYSKKKGKTI